MQQLPLELVYSIFELVYYGHQYRVDYFTLSSCCLVCKPWTPYAQRLLLRDIHLDLSTDQSSLPAWSISSDAAKLLLSGSSNLGTHVRVLSVTLKTASTDVESLASIMSSCPKLYELAFHSAAMYAFSDDDMAALEAVVKGGVRIRSLIVMGFGVQSPAIYQLISLWPSIQFLRIGSEFVASPPPYPSNLALYELALHRLPSPEIVTWLLASSKDTLRIFDCRDILSHGLTSILSPYAPSLRSVRLLRYSEQTANFLSLCINLEEFAVYHIPLVTGFKNLPQSIEHFVFLNPTWSGSHTLQPVIAAVKSLQKLHTVTCDEDSASHRHFPELVAECEGRGIGLKSDALPLWRYDDAVMVNKFPRGRSVANWVLMEDALE
ncbi:hypothetical protein JAAARDRAFT_149190 [Jaapia argillacea MUCL 33604]|uniref:F-box domain-containing protein n=1 Tax=Jaapia argillacea MUCL 33604 TaxID=933084 RepID=A0A067Q892_9AGAM|nr:hypothetical protein JAAARDRAFT_149190 [Jaapia argillacea MUCL 33604]